MSKLELGPILDDKPVKLTVELPANTYLDAYGEARHRGSSQMIEPAKMVAPMLARFMAFDRAIAKARRNSQISGTGRRIAQVTDGHPIQSRSTKKAEGVASRDCRNFTECQISGETSVSLSWM